MFIIIINNLPAGTAAGNDVDDDCVGNSDGFDTADKAKACCDAAFTISATVSCSVAEIHLNW